MGKETASIDIRQSPVQIVRLSVRCESCGHQAIVAVPARGARYPDLYCGECGDCEPLIEPLRR